MKIQMIKSEEKRNVVFFRHAENALSNNVSNINYIELNSRLISEVEIRINENLKFV